MNENTYTSDELQEWLLEKALNAKSDRQARKIIQSNDQRSRATALIGRLYFFKYDPKGKNYLPKYDMFPLVFPLERYGNGFLGLNLHYLSMGGRSSITNMILEYKNNTKMDESTRMLINWQILTGVSKMEGLARQCVKRYLFNHVRSQFIEVYASEYDKAIQIPVEHWHFNT